MQHIKKRKKEKNWDIQFFFYKKEITILQMPDARPDTPHIRSNLNERAEMGPTVLHRGLEVKWEVYLF